MPRKALYFPYIRTPDDDWFTRVLLYWDSVGTIVPGGLETDERYVTPRMKELQEHEALQLVHPMGSLQYADHERAFRDAFLKLVDDQPRPNEMVYSRVHLWKLGVLADELERRGLARRGNGAGGWELWFEVESSTADLFMAYLAVVLASNPKDPMEPVTNHPGSLAALLGRSSQVGNEQRLRVKLLEHLLPTPHRSTPVEELVAFKREHHERLVVFRDVIDEALMDMAESSDLDRRFQFKVEAFVRERDAIVNEMNARRWPNITFGAIGGVGAVGAVVDGVLQQNWLTTAFATAGAAGAAWALMKEWLSPKEYLSKPMAYAALGSKFAGR